MRLGRQPVHHRRVGQSAFEPAAHQRLDVLRLQSPGAQAAVAEFVERVRHPRQRVAAVPPGGVRAVVAGAPLELQKIPVQVAHRPPIP